MSYEAASVFALYQVLWLLQSSSYHRNWTCAQLSFRGGVPTMNIVILTKWRMWIQVLWTLTELLWLLEVSAKTWSEFACWCTLSSDSGLSTKLPIGCKLLRGSVHVLFSSTPRLILLMFPMEPLSAWYGSWRPLTDLMQTFRAL